MSRPEYLNCVNTAEGRRVNFKHCYLLYFCAVGSVKLNKMEETILIIISIVFLILLVISKDDNTMQIDETEDDYSFRNEIRNQNNEEQFYHPVTGYKGTRSEMDAYIQNREREKKHGR